MISDSTPRKAISRRIFLQRIGLGGLGTLALGACSDESEESAATTLDRTIEIGSDRSLLSGPGEPYAVRTELGEAQSGRDGRRRSLIAFHHLSDFRITDEESPARADWQAECLPPSLEAFRPQESLSVQAAEALIGRANALSKSPATGRSVDFAIHTGNAADNAQFNELRWFVDMMDGKPVYPDSGAIGYQGVQTESPASNYGDLLKQAQLPFNPVGLKYPWYAALGNRDVLVFGSTAPGDRATRIATGAQKVMRLGPDAVAEACEGSQVLLGPDSSPTILNDPLTVVRSVGKDANRRFLATADWLAEHFGTADVPGPAGHGFSPDSVASGAAYYAFDRGAVSVIVLNTVNPAGFAAGSIDEPQFLWLEQELITRSSAYYDTAGAQVGAENPDRLIIVATHHPSDALNNPFPGPNAEERRYQGPDLEAMFHRFPNVVLHVAGHTLEHRVVPRPFSGDQSRAYWEITTGSPAAWPMQGRLIEIADNRDGTLSIFSTVYDSAAPINPGDAEDPTPDDNQNQRLLASVARQVAARDPARDDGASGLAASDRNAELILRVSLDTATLPTATAPPREEAP
jgi:metallophosphoesterase (TIGR03767 family)